MFLHAGQVLKLEEKERDNCLFLKTLMKTPILSLKISQLLHNCQLNKVNAIKSAILLMHLMLMLKER